MCNEDLAVLARAGDGEALLKLWAQVNRLAWKQARRWAASGRGGAVVEDLMQSAFVALILAVRTYDPSRAVFSTWFYKYLQREFTAACGLGTKREQLDPLQTAASLDAPLTDDDGGPLTFADIIPDPPAAEQIEGMDVRLAVAAALSELPEEQQRAVRDKYWFGLPVDTKAHAAAMKNLRHPARSKRLMAYL